MNLQLIEKACTLAELAGVDVTISAADLRDLLTIIKQPSPVTRPYCPECGAPLAGWIEHNKTRCPGCGHESVVRWLDKVLVLDK